MQTGNGKEKAIIHRLPIKGNISSNVKCVCEREASWVEKQEKNENAPDKREKERERGMNRVTRGW